jgi:pyruvate kinase
MRRTKIVATIGPASREPESLLSLVEAGMDVARLNYSHGSLDEHAETAQRVRDASSRAGRPVAILQDLPGPKLRIGSLKDGVAECGADTVGDATRMSVTWKELASALEPNEIIYLADGSIRLRVRATRPEQCELDAEVEVGGVVASRQGLNIPGPTVGLPAVPEEDLALLAHGESIGVDMVALSFVRTASEIEFVRERTRLPLIAKIEKPQPTA